MLINNNNNMNLEEMKKIFAEETALLEEEDKQLKLFELSLPLLPKDKQEEVIKVLTVLAINSKEKHIILAKMQKVIEILAKMQKVIEAEENNNKQ